MLADEKTLAALDFPGVLVRVVAATHTARGRRLAAELAPSLDFSSVKRAMSQTAAASELAARADLDVESAIDTADFTQAAALGRTLSGEDLRSIADTLASAAAAVAMVRDDPVLAEVASGYVSLRDLQRTIVDGIDERGVVLDRASPALGRIRRNLLQAQADARERVGAIARSARYAPVLQEHIVTIRDGRFVVPVKADFSGALPGIVHDTSASGQTLFVEPLAVLDANNRVRTLRIEEEREVARILQELSQRTGAQAAEIERDVDVLAAIDLLSAKAVVARGMDAFVPALSDDPIVLVRRGRHPLLGERAVAQSLQLDDQTRALVISGPNMGGKTVALKMVGLFVLMAYCGLAVPAADGTTIGRFDRMIADIGDEQSIVANASTFSAHLDRMREVLERADSRTLAIVDEIGGGTEPSAGAALAIAMLERLLERGAHTIVTTHATELKLFAHARAHVANASVRFDPSTFAPTFHLDVGAPGQSLAFPLARTIGIDERILEHAQRLLDDRERDYESALAELTLRTAEVQSERDGLIAERAAEAARATELRRSAQELELARRDFASKAEDRLAQALRDFARELAQRSERLRPQPKVTPSQAALLDRTIQAMRRDLGIVPVAEPVVAETGLQSGDPVEVLSLAQSGVVVEDYGERVLVAIGPMKTVVEKRDVRRVARPRERAAVRGSQTAQARLGAAARSRGELDVRGKRFVEAEPLVERWIDDALLAGTSELRLIHGKGTGMLGRGLQEYLRNHPAVVDVRYGTEEEGSGGVTIFALRS